MDQYTDDRTANHKEKKETKQQWKHQVFARYQSLVFDFTYVFSEPPPIHPCMHLLEARCSIDPPTPHPLFFGWLFSSSCFHMAAGPHLGWLRSPSPLGRGRTPPKKPQTRAARLVQKCTSSITRIQTQHTASTRSTPNQRPAAVCPSVCLPYSSSAAPPPPSSSAITRSTFSSTSCHRRGGN